jgi:hypothetical protein
MKFMLSTVKIERFEMQIVLKKHFTPDKKKRDEMKNAFALN